MTKTVLITGASSGIGKATTEVFARAGWNVAATSREIDKDLFDEWPHVRVYKLDVTDQTSITFTFEKVVSEFGALDVVVNNAGYGLSGVFEAITDQQIQQQFETNVFGLMRVTRAAIGVMKPEGSGTIIQVASMGGRLTFPLYSVYHGSKWAVEGFSEALSYELRQLGVRIKIIEPGVIKTAFYSRSRVFSKPDANLGYGQFINQVENSSRPVSDKGRPPVQVAQVIYRAATSRSNKMRYIVGYPAPLLLALRKVLPERMFLRLIRTRYHI
jgi:short-subunit dehydrogenase